MVGVQSMDVSLFFFFFFFFFGPIFSSPHSIHFHFHFLFFSFSLCPSIA